MCGLLQRNQAELTIKMHRNRYLKETRQRKKFEIVTDNIFAIGNNTFHGSIIQSLCFILPFFSLQKTQRVIPNYPVDSKTVAAG